MKKINVKEEQCIGCGACIAIDPEHFDFNDDGLSTVISNENLESNNLTNAIESCPTSAINISSCDSDCTCKDECCCDENCNCNHDCSCENCDC